MASTIKNEIIDIEARFISKLINIVPNKAQIKPSLEANIFGALSTIFTGSLKSFIIKDDATHRGL